ncbi:hypothetical protein IWZ00DRAFT_108259 [Phyllosticta capitalensis]
MQPTAPRQLNTLPSFHPDTPTCLTRPNGKVRAPHCFSARAPRLPPVSTLLLPRRSVSPTGQGRAWHLFHLLLTATSLLTCSSCGQHAVADTPTSIHHTHYDHAVQSTSVNALTSSACSQGPVLTATGDTRCALLIREQLASHRRVHLRCPHEYPVLDSQARIAQVGVGT